VPEPRDTLLTFHVHLGCKAGCRRACLATDLLATTKKQTFQRHDVLLAVIVH